MTKDLGQFKLLVSPQEVAAIKESQAKSAALSQSAENSRFEMQQKMQEQQKTQAKQQLKSLAISGNKDAFAALASVDTKEADAVADLLYKRSEREAAYATAINLAPRDKKAEVFKSVRGMAAQDPLVDKNSLSQWPDEYTSDLDPKLYAISQSHRQLENALKAQQEAANLAQTQASTDNTRANTAKTYADINKTRIETEQLNGGTKPLSADATKTLTIAKGGLQGISDIKSLLFQKDKAGNEALKPNAQKNLGGAAFLPNFIQPEQTQKFETARTNLIDEIGRLRSGGQISGNEETNFRKLIPKFGDKPETIKFKLSRLEKNFQDIEKGITGKNSAVNQNTGGDPLGLFSQ
jgi:hypothetical protein